MRFYQVGEDGGLTGKYVSPSHYSEAMRSAWKWLKLLESLGSIKHGGFNQEIEFHYTYNGKTARFRAGLGL